MAEAKNIRIKIHGKVQGVLFRASAKRKAQELELSGFARNEPDGTVLIEVEGEEDKLKQFVVWCWQGPEVAKVEKVDYFVSHDLRKYDKFEIY